MKTTNNTEQVSGKHYEMEIEPVHIIAALKLNWFQGEILKYVSRHRRKNGISDLNKAIHVCDMAKDLNVKNILDKSLWIDNRELVSNYLSQFNEEGVYLLTFLFKLYHSTWEEIRESIIKYKEQCYEKS